MKKNRHGTEVHLILETSMDTEEKKFFLRGKCPQINLCLMSFKILIYVYFFKLWTNDNYNYDRIHAKFVNSSSLKSLF